MSGECLLVPRDESTGRLAPGRVPVSPWHVSYASEDSARSRLRFIGSARPGPVVECRRGPACGCPSLACRHSRYGVPVLPNVTATRYVTPLREGGSLPAIAEADDLGTYVVKFHGAGQG